MADIDYDKLAAAILRQQQQQQQQQLSSNQQRLAESEISTRNAGKSSLNDTLTWSRRLSIDIQLFKQLIYNRQKFAIVQCLSDHIKLSDIL